VNVSSERTVSLWMNVDVAAEAKPLRTDLSVDTVIVGSGIAGLSTAYELASAGQKVAVLDRGPIGKGMTSRTTAHLSSICDDSFDSLIKLRGLEAAKAFYESQSAAVDRIEAIQDQEAIACNFRRLNGYLFPALGQEPSVLDPELEAARKVGVDMKDTHGIPFKGLGKVRCLEYRRQGTFHPSRYLRGLAASIESRGGVLHADTCVEGVEEKDGGVVVTTSKGAKVRARCAVIATNSPINERVVLHTKQAPYRSYAMAFTIPRDEIPDGLYWDTLDPYHYVRLNPGPGNTDYLIVGGADHKTGEADDGDIRFEAIEAWMRNLVPALGRETHRWSGQVMETIDYTAFIGRNPGSEVVYVATGDSGQGMTHGVVASLLISDLILGRESPWKDLYEPSRKTISAVKTFISENVTTIKNFAEYVAPGELKSLDELKPGQGAIVRQGLHKIAAYRDESGKLYQRSAACTHIGCHVHWNSLERCWDCPCHGSHFAVDGTALNGPAVSPLAKAGT
jgi:glycine/D-amino acid oxidase-like deaminating enzyme/nitrite reductase/ring-hydroxylating ferredoxin subunit